MDPTGLSFCTFEVATPVGRHRRVGVVRDGRIGDVNFAAAWYLAQTNEAEPQRFADAVVPSNMLDFLRAGLRAIHTSEDLFFGAGPHPHNWWTLDGSAPRGPNDETLVYTPEQVRLCAPLPGRGVAGPEEEIQAGEWRPSVAAVMGGIGLSGFMLINECGGVRSIGPYLVWYWVLGTTTQIDVTVRVNGVETHLTLDKPTPESGTPGDIVPAPSPRSFTLSPGDVIELEAPHLGLLRNRVR
jgi:hypothetical protein